MAEKGGCMDDGVMIFHRAFVFFQVTMMLCLIILNKTLHGSLNRVQSAINEQTVPV